LAAGTGTIVDDDRYTEVRGELLRDRAPGDVDAAAGRIGHDDADGFRGIRLRESRRRIQH